VDQLVRIASRAVPLLLDDVDTDVITPIRRVLEGMPSLVEHAFEALRFRADGTLDPDCPLNDPRYTGAEILLAGRNFGCGSSRETAVWAVKGRGFRCVVAASFGDIFRSNCFKNGVLSVAVAPADVAALGAEARAAAGDFVVDLERCRITTPGGRVVAFELSALRREALLHGLDDLGLTLRRRAALESFARADRARRPWAYPARADRS
jgi:3-isopropylmalate/(R)-2-methylmalate dehydratase small subunit